MWYTFVYSYLHFILKWFIVCLEFRDTYSKPHKGLRKSLEDVTNFFYVINMYIVHLICFPFKKD